MTLTIPDWVIWVAGTAGAMVALALMAIVAVIVWWAIRFKGNFHIW